MDDDGLDGEGGEEAVDHHGVPAQEQLLVELVQQELLGAQAVGHDVGGVVLGEEVEEEEEEGEQQPGTWRSSCMASPYCREAKSTREET